MKDNQLMIIDTITIDWQCTGCEHYCKLLTDRFITPKQIVTCKNGIEKWIMSKEE